MDVRRILDLQPLQHKISAYTAFFSYCSFVAVDNVVAEKVCVRQHSASSDDHSLYRSKHFKLNVVLNPKKGGKWSIQ